ncbi:hypothetical protein LEMLEM_LOCUS27591, partial [Lemmus lemmus]
MENIGYDLEKNEYEDLINNLPINDDGMVNVYEVIDKGSLFTGEKIDLVELDDYLESIGIKLPEDKMMKLLGKLPTDESGKLYKKRLIKELENIEGIKIPSNKVKDFIKNAEINLDDEDIQVLMDHLPVDRNRKADFRVLINEIKKITGEKIHVEDVRSVLENVGIELTDKENRKLLKTLPVSADKTLFKKELLSGVKSFK